MKNITAVFAFCLFPLVTIAQFYGPDSQGRIYYNNGNVGIHNISPEGVLHVGGLGSAAYVYFSGNINGSGNPQDVQGLSFGWNRSGALGESLITYNTSLGENPRLTFNSFNGANFKEEMALVGGNLGIGTSSPLDKLHVNGDLSIRPDDANTPSYINFKRDYDGWIAARVGQVYNNLNYGGHLTFETNSGAGSMSIVERMRITYDGNIGVGTATPQAKLEIRGSSIRLSDVDVRYLSISQDAEGTPFGRGWSNGMAGGRQFKLTGWSHLPDNSGSVLRDVVHFDGYNLLLLKDNGGSIGIGTSKPDAMLTVNGNIHTKEVKVDLDIQAPDYVFEKEYDLLSLPELETYIKQNKHLPEVPSAKEMEANGLNLKEMNLMLLKKVEELTLHLIEIKKEVVQLQEDNQNLKTQIIPKCRK